MTTTLPRLARELGTTERTLRRALAQGLLHAERPSPRLVAMSLGECVYLRRSWSLLAGLRKALRTESGLSLAVLFGSTARGDGYPDSDLDLLVAFKPLRTGPARGRRRSRSLGRRLASKLGREVQVVSLADAEDAPLLLSDVLRDGRVLVDRGGLWADIAGRRTLVDRAAARERRQIDRRFDELVGGAGSP